LTHPAFTRIHDCVVTTSTIVRSSSSPSSSSCHRIIASSPPYTPLCSYCNTSTPHPASPHLASPAVDTALLKLAAILTHNVGDVDQGLSYWKEGDFPEQRALFARLAHERNERFGGEFARAKHIYKELLRYGRGKEGGSEGELSGWCCSCRLSSLGRVSTVASD
jgi:hypothetical protein